MGLKEMGRIGQKRYGGIFYEEFLRELQGNRGVQVYREMADNDSTVGAILFAIEMLIRQVDWTISPGGTSPIDEEASDFVESCLGDMQTSWADTLSEVLSFLQFGWSLHEIVYKRRMGRNSNFMLNSKYDDGLIGWQKLPIRSQETLWKWDYDDSDNLLAFEQMPPPDFGILTIPRERFMLFRTKSRKDNPEGRSILRTAYRDWYFKKRIQEIEGIGIERDLAGFPVLIGPENVDLWDTSDPDIVATKAAADNLVKNIRRDALEGLTIPHDWELTLLSTGSRRQFDTSAIIQRYNTSIAMTVLADFILLGHQQVGSFALSSDKTEMFSVAIGAFLDIICEEFNNNSIPKLIDMNSDHFSGITDYPELTHGDIETQDLASLGTYIQQMVGMGVITPDAQLEEYVRNQGGIPEYVGDSNGDTGNVKK
jgi:hypothetical protein